MSTVRVALDGMGTDRHPAQEVAGAVQALRELSQDFEILLVGDPPLLEAEVAQHHDYPADRLTIVPASGRIGPAEAPATAVRRKRNSSVVVGLMLQREGQADAFISAGSTGAVMAASMLILHRLHGVHRPAIATVLPTAAEPVVLLDAGANVESKPEHLFQFAQLGVAYAEAVMGRMSPRVGLLNIGEEPEKGTEEAVEAHRLLCASDLNFIGNVEGRDIIPGNCDVVVTDGFTGNVLLKFYESVAGYASGLLTEELASSGIDSRRIDRVVRALDYSEYGGAPLLGVNGISIICHGGSSPRAIRNGIRMAVQSVRNQVVSHIVRELEPLRRAAEGA